MKEYFTIGKIVRPHGIKGAVRAETYTSNPQRFKKLKEVIIDSKTIAVESVSIDPSNFMLIKLVGIDTMDDAEKLRNKNVVIKRSQLPEPENGTYYIDDLIGSDVLVDGEKIGILTKIEQFGSADVYEVTLEQGTVNFPAIKDVFSYVDVKKGVINLKGYIFSRICVYN